MATGHISRVEIVGYLVRQHRVFFVTTVAVRVDAGNSVAFNCV